MTRVRDRLAAESLLMHRVLMAAASLFTTGFWFIYQGLVPEEWDPLWPRLVISAGVLLPLAASYASDFVRRHIERFSFLTAQLIVQWIVVLAAVNEFSVTRVVGVVLVQYCAGYLFSSIRTNIALHALTLLGLSIGLLLVPTGWVGGTFTLVTVATTAIFNVLFVVIYVRTVEQLVAREDQLREARDHLEERVAERTMELESEVKERRSAEKRAYEASRAKSLFLANMSHELRTPLNAVIGYAELVHEDLDDATNREARADLQRILDAASYLLRMINDILDLAKVESGAWEYVFEDTDVDDLVARAATTVAPLVVENDNAFEADVEPGLPLLSTDRIRLTQVLVNLANNAAKFTQGGHITVRARREVRVGTLGLRIDVIDTGPGIPADQLERVFDKFVQLQDPGAPKRRGTGLGLAIGREMVRGLDGELTVRSTVGKGSTFTVWVPWRPSSTAVPAPTRTAS